MPYVELRDWMEFYATVEPFGERRADYRAALLATLLAEPNRDRKKRPQPYRLDDFLLFQDETRREAPETSKGARISPSLITGLLIAADRTAAAEE